MSNLNNQNDINSILSNLGYSPVHGAGDLDYPHAVKYTVCITSIFRRQEER
jgi:hypothetical protein